MAMDLGGGKGKKKISPEMNITPLVDVVLVLLIIFMVLAPVIAEALYVRLPPKDETEQKLDNVTADPGVPLVLSVHENGEFDVNSVPISRDQLAMRLHRMFNARPDNVLYIDGHDDVRFEHVIMAIDEAREGSASPIVMITKKLE